MSASNLSECIICLSTFQSELCKDPEYFTSVFDAFCCVMEINLMGPMGWNFVQDNIPFCEFCYLAVDRLKGLYDQLNLIQKDLNDVLGLTRQKILTSGCASKISNEPDEIDRVNYFRQQAVRGVQLAENPLNVEILTLQEHTDVLLKLEINEEENNETTSSFLDCIKDEPAFEGQIDLDDSFNGSSNDGDIETACTSDNDLLCRNVKDDFDLLVIKSEDNEEGVEDSRSTSDVLISDPVDTNHCSYYEKPFQSQCSLTIQLKCPLEEELECENQVFETRNSLEPHGIQIHDSAGAYKCDVCHKHFYSANDIQRHAAAHNRVTPFKCDVCRKSFTQLQHLKQHKKIHTVDRPYKCSTCDKCFAQKGHLTSHIRTHTSEKPFKCNACGNCYKRNSDLVRHVRIHTGEKSYKCDTCDKGYSRKSQLIDHVKIHTGEKPYKCDTCNKCFRRKYNLIGHKIMHTGEKSFKCDTCYKCFIRKWDLIRHKRIHTGEKP